MKNKIINFLGWMIVTFFIIIPILLTSTLMDIIWDGAEIIAIYIVISLGSKWIEKVDKDTGWDVEKVAGKIRPLPYEIPIDKR